MVRKFTVLAAAAIAAIGLTLLSPSTADARAGHGGGIHRAHGGGHGGGHGVRRFGGHRHIGHFRRHRPHWRGHRWRHRHVRHWCWRHPWRCRRPVWYYPRPVVYAARPAIAGPCTCLSKSYTPEGAVLFKDNCTNEMAMNPPAVAPAAQVEPQQPQAAYAPPAYAQQQQPQAYVPQYPPQQQTAAPTTTQ